MSVGPFSAPRSRSLGCSRRGLPGFNRTLTPPELYALVATGMAQHPQPAPVKEPVISCALNFPPVRERTW
jgi:hypothetical protein